MRAAPIPLGIRSRLALVLASVIGVMAFCWPLIIDPGGVLGDGGDATLVFAMLLPVVMAVVLTQVSEGGIDAKALAMIGVLAAVGAALRPIGAGTAGLEPVFFLLVLAGRVLGPGAGFVLGAVTLFASGLLTGGVGPWLPFQMVAAAWVGLGAGLLPRCRGRWELLLLSGYGAVASLIYGLAMNLTFWPFTLGPSTALSFSPQASVPENLHAFALFHLATSMGFDVGRALTTVALLLIAGPAVLLALRRAARRAAFAAPVVFEEHHEDHERRQRA